MKRPTMLLCLPLFLTACDQGTRDGLISPIRPAATRDPTPAPSPAPIGRPISVGDEVKGVFTGVAQVFEFTVPADGRLVAAVDLGRLVERHDTDASDAGR